MKNNLKAIREKALMLQTTLSDKTGLTVATISRIEQGHRLPHFSTRRTLARILKVTVEDLGFDGSK